MDNETLKYLDSRFDRLRKDIKEDFTEIRKDLKSLQNFKFKVVGIALLVSALIPLLTHYITIS